MASDIHAHIIPRPVLAAAASGTAWHGISIDRSANGSLEGRGPHGAFDLPGWSGSGETIEDRVRRMDELRVSHHVLSVTPSLFRYELDPLVASAMAADMNDDLADIARSMPARFSALAHLPLQDRDAAMRELERTVAQPGMVGVAAGTHVNGADWDTAELFPILEAIESSGQILFLHPANRRPDPRMQRYHLKNLIGNPLEILSTMPKGMCPIGRNERMNGGPDSFVGLVDASARSTRGSNARTVIWLSSAVVAISCSAIGIC